MKNLKICLTCHDMHYNDVFISSTIQMAKLLILILDSKKEENEMNIKKYICPECYKFFPKEYLEKIRSKHSIASNSQRVKEQTSP